MDSLKLRLRKFISHLLAQYIRKCSLTTLGKLHMHFIPHFVENNDRILGKEVLHWMIFTHFLQFHAERSLLFFKIFNIEVFLGARILHQFIVILHMS